MWSVAFATLSLPAFTELAARDLLKHAFGDSFNGRRDFSADAEPGAEIARLDSINHQASRELTQGSAEFEGFAQAESVC